MKQSRNYILITKASGETVPFLPEKLQRSLLRAGASAEQAHSILKAIEDGLYPGITTKRIYQYAFNLLRQHSKPLAARYKLKTAIMELGPSGFPFEKFIAAFLSLQGYQTITGKIVEGNCVKHEVDIIAEKEDYHLMIECKYHNRPGTVCDVKIPLYVHSRFKDVEASWMKLPEHKDKLRQGWVVTNTKFTIDAIQYGTCIGLHLLGWNYPHKSSLNEQIDRLSLYPLTCLTTLSKKEKQNLLEKNIVLCREIFEKPALLTQAGVSERRISNIVREAYDLCYKILNNGTHL